MLEISNHSRILCGVVLITVPTIEYGGVFLLGMLRKPESGYTKNPLRQNLFRAGHAHAGVLVILSLVCLSAARGFHRTAGAAGMDLQRGWVRRLAALLVPAGFFFSVASPRAERPNGLIGLTYLGALVLAISVLVLGAGLVRAGLA